MLEIVRQLVSTQINRVRFLDNFTSIVNHAPLSYVSLSSGTRTSTGAIFFMAVSQAEQNLLSPNFSALRHKIQPLSPHLEYARVRQLPRIGTLAITTYDLWVIRQYFPTLPFTSPYTMSVHPGVAQIPDIAGADEDRQRGLRTDEPGCAS